MVQPENRRIITEASLNSKLDVHPRLSESNLSNTFAPTIMLPAPSGDATGIADHAAIQAKLNAAETLGATLGRRVRVLGREGTYLIFEHLKIGSYVELHGAGRHATSFKLCNGGGGNSVIRNKSWTDAPTGWATTEHNYGLRHCTIDGNKSGVFGFGTPGGFRYGATFMCVQSFDVEDVHFADTHIGSGLWVNNGYDVTIKGVSGSGCGGNTVYLSGIIRFLVDVDSISDCGDFGVEIGSGYDFGLPGSTAYCGDGYVRNSGHIRDCVNYGIAIRGYLDATANPSNRYVQNVTVNPGTIKACGIAPYIQYELVRDITLAPSGNFIHGGVRQRLQKRIVDDLAGVDITSGASGAWTDLAGLDQSFTPVSDCTARIYLRAQFTAGAAGLHGLKGVVANSAPIAGKTTVVDLKTLANGEVGSLSLAWEVQLAGGSPYQVKAQFYNGAGGTLAIDGDVETTDLLIVTEPLA